MRRYRRSIANQGTAKHRRRLPLRLQRFVLRIDLADTHPPIWRRIESNSDLTLDKFHRVIQTAFEWDDRHLHEFARVGPGRQPKVERFLMPYMIEEGDVGIAEATVRLGDVLTRPNDMLMYMYDFGDSWEHRICLKTVEGASPEFPRVACTAGERAAPPEDCGGVWGHQFMVEAGLDPKHPDHQEAAERIEWMFGDNATFDPEQFDLDRID